MSVKNLVQCPLITPVSSTATELLLGAVSAPYSLPPLDGGILVISDSPSKPSFVEFITYTHRIDNVLYGVSRGLEETAARNWSGVTYVYQALTADQYTSELASKEPVIPPGTAAQYWRGDKSFQDLATAIRAANLTGFSTATNSAVVSTDTLLAALGKLQAQMNVRLLSTANAVSATKLQTARTISVAGDATGSLTFDGTANVSMDVTLQPSGVSAGTYTKLTVDSKGLVTAGASLLASDVPTLNQSTTGNAATATKLQTARTIGGVAFDGSANINLPGVNTAGNQSTSGNAATATKLATARTLTVSGAAEGSVAFDGSANVSIATTTPRYTFTTDPTSTFRASVFGANANMVKVLRTNTAGFANFPQYSSVLSWSTDDTHAFLSVAHNTNKVMVGGGSGTGIVWSRDLAFTDSDITGNAATATALETARTINGVSFNGTSNITITATDPNSVTKTGDVITGKISVGDTAKRSAGMYGLYDSAKIGHVWSMGTSYAIPDDGSTFGSLYGMAYKHTNNTTGGTMASGHQIVFCSNGSPGVAIGLAGNVWNSGTYYGSGAGLTSVPAASLSGVVPDANLSGSYTGVSITGNAATATKLATARTINGVAFDGSANITLPNTDGTPAGAVMAFARSTAPAGWLKANGSAISRTTYSALFAAIGTTFGAGDGSTTFNLPDLRGEFLRGWDDARGVDSGRTFGSWQDSDNKSHAHTTSTTSYAHTHTWSGTTSSAGAHSHTQRVVGTGYVDGTSGSRGSSGTNNANGGADTAAGEHTHTVSGTTSSDSHTHTVTVNAAGGVETRPRNIALLYCIKF